MSAPRYSHSFVKLAVICTVSMFNLYVFLVKWHKMVHQFLCTIVIGLVLNSDTTEHAHYVECYALIRIKRINHEAAHLWDY